MHRLIIVDTETTGFSTRDGHRIIEFCALEMIDNKLTGEKLHLFFNPERDVPAESTKVHGITLAELEDKTTFAEQADQILEFIGDSRIIAHNAPFDIRFLEYEFNRGKADNELKIAMAIPIDTLAVARRLIKGKGAKHTLDALCDRFKIDRTKRANHGALIDCELLYQVYIKLNSIEQIDTVVAKRLVNFLIESSNELYSAPVGKDSENGESI